jgi:ABC-2 type transport system ATP-binding protein
MDFARRWMLSFQTVATNKPEAETYAVTGGIAGTAATIASPPLYATRKPVTGDALTVVDLCKSFRSGFLKRHIRGIEGVSFTVPRGSVFALLGHNGAGKTTTINCILDLVHADRGEVSLMGQDHRRCESRACVGYLPERPYFFEHLTGRELLGFYADLLSLPSHIRLQRITDVLERTGMTEHAGRRLSKFSKGMLQRIGLAQTLLGDPDLLILDEPMSGLDPMGRRDVRELLLELKAQGKTIILSSHIVPDVEMLADNVGILRNGHLVETRNLREFNNGCTYHVDLDCSGGQAAGLALPDWVQNHLQSAANDHLTVEPQSIDQLRELLAACHANDIPVQSVDTRRTGLEEFFMSVHSDSDTGNNSKVNS